MGKRVSTRELGLILGVHLLKTDHLHYGMWSPELTLSLANLPAAQEAYCQFIVAHLPPGMRSVLDVGSGTGGLAQALQAAGYAVECLSPSVALNEFARRRLGPGVTVHDVGLEQLQPHRRFDALIFSESFQYIPPAVSLDKARTLLNPYGHVLICDFFSRDMPERGPLGGGHRLSEFMPMIAARGFRVVHDEDITARMAPNLDLVAQLLRERAVPMWLALGAFLRTNYPRTAALGAWLFRKKLNKIHRKYLTGERNGANFARYKTYRLMLLQLAD